MKKETNVTEKKTMRKKLSNIGAFLNKHVPVFICVLMIGIMVSGVASASTADTLWNTIANLLKKWVTRLGGVVMFVGGIMFGLGWKSDDAEQKSRGISTIIAGGIVTAIAAITGTFFA